MNYSYHAAELRVNNDADFLIDRDYHGIPEIETSSAEVALVQHRSSERGITSIVLSRYYSNKTESLSNALG